MSSPRNRRHQRTHQGTQGNKGTPTRNTTDKPLHSALKVPLAKAVVFVSPLFRGLSLGVARLAGVGCARSAALWTFCACLVGVSSGRADPLTSRRPPTNDGVSPPLNTPQLRETWMDWRPPFSNSWRFYPFALPLRVFRVFCCFG